MDSVLGSVWMVGVVLMSGGLALVGLGQDASDPVHLETRSLVWGDGHGRQLGDAVDVEHIRPAGAHVLVTYDGGQAHIQLDRGDRLWFPCPTGPDDWITFTAGGRVLEKRRVTGCSPTSTGSIADDASPATPTDDDGQGDLEDWCPDGHEALDGFVCIPTLAPVYT